MNLFEQLVYEDNHCIMSLAMTGTLNKIRKLAKEELKKDKLVYIVTNEVTDDEIEIKDPKLFIFHKSYNEMISQFKQNIQNSNEKVSVLFSRIHDLEKFNKDSKLLYKLTDGNIELFAFVQLENGGVK